MFDAIFAIDPPNIDNDRKDKVVWVNGSGKCCNFSVLNVWEDRRNHSQIVPWASLVLFSQCIPIHLFMMWLVVNKILKTHDTMGVWEQKVDMTSDMHVPLIQYNQQLASTWSSHETCFIQAADSMFFMLEGLQQARARIYDVPSAIKILLTRTYQCLPKFTEDVGIHSTLTDKQQKPVLKKLDSLVKSNYLTLHYPNSSSRILDLEVLVGETSGPVKLEEMRRSVLGDDLERRMAAFDTSVKVVLPVLFKRVKMEKLILLVYSLRVIVPDFQPKQGVKIDTDENVTKLSSTSIDYSAVIDELIKKLESHRKILSSGYVMKPIQFEKVKEYQEKDKIGSKSDKNGKRGEARKSLKQLQ
nr:hypothetical protein [Tanacetum cinerariifolium]